MKKAREDTLKRLYSSHWCGMWVLYWIALSLAIWNTYAIFLLGGCLKNCLYRCSTCCRISFEDIIDERVQNGQVMLGDISVWTISLTSRMSIIRWRENLEGREKFDLFCYKFWPENFGGRDTDLTKTFSDYGVRERSRLSTKTILFIVLFLAVAEE